MKSCIILIIVLFIIRKSAAEGCRGRRLTGCTEYKARPRMTIDYAEKAEELFKQGYNCSQAVLCAFSDITGLERETAARLASSFGGGLGRMREVCGAVSGASMVLGLVKGYSDSGDRAAKSEHYRLIREFARRFSEENGSIICRELLGIGKDQSAASDSVTVGGEPEERTPEYYKKRPCPELVRDAARITAELLGL